MDDVARMGLRDRRDLFSQAAAEQGYMAPEVIEKDFWVCWALKRVFELDPTPTQLIFKGGTSLSKVYGVIERFSEDVDLSLSREGLGFVGDRDPCKATTGKKGKKLIAELRKECTDVIAKTLVPALQSSFAQILGGGGDGIASKSSWSLVVDKLDPDVAIFSYPPGIETTLNYIPPLVRLEFGARADHWPDEKHDIRPYAAEVIPEAFKNPICQVRTLSAERTFWEKVVILHKESHRTEDKPSGERLSRHYYDVAKLFQSEVGPKALAQGDLLEAVVKHTRLFFSSKWANYDTAAPGSLRLIPPKELRSALEADYRAMQENMIFGESCSFDELLGILGEIEAAINAKGDVA